MPGFWRTTSGTGERASGLDPPEPVFTDTEQQALLALAAGGVRTTVLGCPLPSPCSDLPVRLLETAGAFVSLHIGDALRGCIGSLLPDVPLAALVPRLAADAATRDPRFLPVQATELAQLQIEVSVLSPVLAVSVEELDPQRHGVCLRLGNLSAVLLPQVAIREGWDRAQLLAALCEKAGLAPGAERDPAALLLAFTVTTVDGRVDAPT
jgi:AmmeMemoRadiSam system protein A